MVEIDEKGIMIEVVEMIEVEMTEAVEVMEEIVELPKQVMSVSL